MFSSALKSFSSNISSNYSIAPQPTTTAGPWKIFDAKKKGKGPSVAVSVFVFDKKTLDPVGGGLGGRTNAASLKRAHEEVLERLKKEANSLARLRHPSILQLVEPVEDTRNGGLMFATEPVTASLAGLLSEKDEEERSGGVGGRGSRYVVEESDGKSRRRRELELDELEIQKGLLQIAKGLDFLHQSAGLVHGNLNPDAIFVNPKSDWKISGLAFSASPVDLSAALSEVLNQDPRLPPSVQLNLDYCSPDFVMDQNVTPSADMFSLGMLIIALYNSPHQSPLETHGSLSSYKRLFSSSSSIPSQQNSFLSAGKLPKDLSANLLPRLITRRPAQRINATEFQEAQYFDNVLVSTIRFLDGFPAKTPNEKSQFMRGLPRIMPQFPRSVLERKILPVLLDEMKDRDLLALILQNVFAIVTAMPSGKRAFTDTVVPRLRDIFLQGSSKTASERDPSRDAGLMVVLEHMALVADNCSGKEFRDDILPIIALGLGSQTHALVDAALSTLPAVLPVLDYSTIKNELFPVIANVFTHTSSLAIKIRGLEAFNTLCGGTEASDDSIGDGLDGVVARQDSSKNNSSAVLDKYTVQEKVVPLLKSIKTKEPDVMMAALKVLRQVGKVADSDFLAMETLPILWTFALGPLLDLNQFQAFMSLIRSISSHIEREQTRKLQELSSSNGAPASRTTAKQSTWAATSANAEQSTGDVDFENLVTGRKSKNGTPDIMNDWGAPAGRPNASRTPSQQQAPAPTNFTWSTAQSTMASKPPSTGQMNALRAPQPATRTVTPDQSLNSGFSVLTPNTPYSQPLQPTTMVSRPAQQPIIGNNSQSTAMSSTPAINWSSAASNNASSWAAQRPANSGLTNAPMPPPAQRVPSFTIPPPPTSRLAAQPSPAYSSFNNAPPANGLGARTQPAPAAPAPKKGLDMYQSLL